MKSCLVALQFLTTLPVKFRRAPGPDDIGKAVRFFPFVGLILGSILVFFNWVFNLFLSTNVTALFLVILLLMLTGMIHLDGFLDSCDGLFGYKTPERRLEIMRDSRVGSFAVGGGWALLTLKFVALLSIPADLMIQALLLSPMLARWGMVNAVVFFPYGRPDGLGKEYKRNTGIKELSLISLYVVIIAAIGLRVPGLIVVIIIFALVLLLGKYIMTKLPDGLTGDNYGAITEVCEVVTWLVVGAAANLIRQYI